MAEKSGLFRAGEIVLLVGAILSAVSAFAFLALGVLVAALLAGGGSSQEPPLQWFLAAYVGLGVVSTIGAVVGFLAYGRARLGDARGASIRGFVASLLPPVHLVLLLGAIFCLVSAEGDAQKGRPPPGPAQADHRQR